MMDNAVTGQEAEQVTVRSSWNHRDIRIILETSLKIRSQEPGAIFFVKVTPDSQDFTEPGAILKGPGLISVMN